MNAYVRSAAGEVILQVAAVGDPEVLELAEGMPLGGSGAFRFVGLPPVIMHLWYFP